MKQFIKIDDKIEEENMEKFKSYHKRAEERFRTQGLLPRPLKKSEVEEFVQLICLAE